MREGLPVRLQRHQPSPYAHLDGHPIDRIHAGVSRIGENVGDDPAGWHPLDHLLQPIEPRDELGFVVVENRCRRRGESEVREREVPRFERFQSPERLQPLRQVEAGRDGEWRIDRYAVVADSVATEQDPLRALEEVR